MVEIKSNGLFGRVDGKMKGYKVIVIHFFLSREESFLLSFVFGKRDRKWK